MLYKLLVVLLSLVSACYEASSSSTMTRQFVLYIQSFPGRSNINVAITAAMFVLVFGILMIIA